jgi:phage baseplate assembly protein gpV
MSDMVDTIRAIVRDELRRVQFPDLGVVSAVFPRSGESDKNNHQVNLKLRGTALELQKVPVAVGRLGLSALPNVGDLMVVAFIGGDLNAPVALAAVYDHQRHPPVAEPHELVYQPPDDAESNVRRVHIELQDGSSVSLDDDKLSVSMGGTSLVIEKDGDVSIEAKGDIQLKSDGKIALQAGGDISLEASGNLTLKGTSTSVEGQSNAKLKAPQISVGGNVAFSPS